MTRPRRRPRLANFTGDTVPQVADQAQHDIQRACESASRVIGVLVPIDDRDRVESVSHLPRRSPDGRL